MTGDEPGHEGWSAITVNIHAGRSEWVRTLTAFEPKDNVRLRPLATHQRQQP